MTRRTMRSKALPPSMSLVVQKFGGTSMGSMERIKNAASRALLEKCGYKYEGVAQSYLQINGRWRNHVLYANLRRDRRGRVEG